MILHFKKATVNNSSIPSVAIKSNYVWPVQIFYIHIGMTELSPVCHFLTPGAPLDKIGSCGGPVPNTLTKIMDVSTGETLGKNERGEICVKGPQVKILNKKLFPNLKIPLFLNICFLKGYERLLQKWRGYT